MSSLLVPTVSGILTVSTVSTKTSLVKKLINAHDMPRARVFQLREDAEKNAQADERVNKYKHNVDIDS